MSDKYDLSSICAISAAAEQVRFRAGQEPGQGSYNAARLHGYAQALADAAEQLESRSQHEKSRQKKKREGRHER